MDTNFTPLASLIGGAMIGLSAVIMMGGLGRIAGISGLVARLLPPAGLTSGAGVAAAFVVGLLIAAAVYRLATGQFPQQSVEGSALTFIVAGLLVGFGAVLGSGCTSGHGVCGLSRLSLRSLAATVTFMVSAAATVFLIRHVV
jgi:uncharacterized protein